MLPRKVSHSFDPSLKKGKKGDDKVTVKLIQPAPAGLYYCGLLYDVRASYPIVMLIFPPTSPVNACYAITVYIHSR